MARLRSGRAFGLAAGALAAALETAQPTAASMGLFGRAGTRANGTDRSPVRSRAGACSRVRRGYGLVAARKNSLASCRWCILSVHASLICRRCGSYRLVKTFVVSYLTTRVAGPWRSYLTTRVVGLRSYLTTRVAGRCAGRSCLTTRVAGVPRTRCATTCTASGSATTCTASGSTATTASAATLR